MPHSLNVQQEIDYRHIYQNYKKECEQEDSLLTQKWKVAHIKNVFFPSDLQIPFANRFQ